MIDNMVNSSKNVKNLSYVKYSDLLEKNADSNIRSKQNISIFCTAVIRMKYCRYGVKHYPINQSYIFCIIINNSLNN